MKELPYLDIDDADILIPTPSTPPQSLDRHVEVDYILQTMINAYRLSLDNDDVQKSLEISVEILDNRSNEVIDATYQSLVSDKLALLFVLEAVVGKSFRDHHVLETISFAHCLQGSTSLFGIIDGLREYDGILPVMDDYSKSTGIVRQQTAALITLASTLAEELPGLFVPSRQHEYIPLKEVTTKKGTYAVKITDENLVRYLLSNTEHAEQISKIMIQRKTTDLDLIDSIIHSTAPSINTGVL